MIGIRCSLDSCYSLGLHVSSFWHITTPWRTDGRTFRWPLRARFAMRREVITTVPTWQRSYSAASSAIMD